MDSDTIRNDRGMSKRQHALLIQPPLFPKECPVERVEFGGFPCSYCHGNGWFWGVDDYGERIKQDCPVCKGNKRLKAVVTVNWTADDSSNNQ